MGEEKGAGSCPYCQSQMTATELTCGSCKVSIRGEFRPGPLSLLTPEEQEFLVDFLLSGASIKDTEERIGMSYPAVRSRLDRVVAHLQELDSKKKATARILDEISSGKLSVDDAVRKIKKL